VVDKHQLDKMHGERVGAAVKAINSGSDDAFEKLLLSERVAKDLDSQNVLLHSFNEDAIRAYLPYSERIYVLTCPACVTPENIQSYRTLLTSSSIVPVLGSSYNFYPDEFVDLTYSHDHVGAQEYYALRSLFSGAGGYPRVCGHCVEERAKVIRALVEKSDNRRIVPKNVRALLGNLHPYVEPDFALIDQLEEAIRLNQTEVARAIIDMTWTLSKMRSATAFNAPLIVPGEAFSGLPEDYSSDIDTVRSRAAESHKRISDGLGIRIPDGLPLEAYIELAQDFRPRIAAIIDEVVASSEDQSWQHSLDRQIMNLNAEAARLSKSKRYIALAAVVEFYRNNQIKLNAALVAGALSLSGGALACIGGAATAVAGVAKNKGLVSTGPAINRATRTLKNSVQPSLDKLIGRYVGASPLAVSVVTLKKDLQIQ